MPAFNVSAAVWTFIQSADAAAMRTNIGLAFTQSGSAALTQTGNFTIGLVGVANVTLTLPGVTGTLATLAGTENLTNKTITSGALTTCTIGSAGVTFSGSASGSTVLRASATASGTLTLPAATDTLVGRATTDTLQNKTLVAPVLGSATATTINGTAISASGSSSVHVAGAWSLGTGGTGGVTFLSSGAATLTLPAGTVTLYGSGSGTITSAQLRTSLTDETGTGAAVFATSPTLVTPVLGVATGTSLVLSGALTAGTTVLTSLEVSDNITSNGGTISTTGIITGSLRPMIALYPTDGAISLFSGIHQITKASVAAMSVAAPSSQDGELLYISSGSDFAHVVTFTGGTLRDGTTGGHTTVTFPAFAGSSVTVFARGSDWYLLSNNGTTIT